MNIKDFLSKEQLGEMEYWIQRGREVLDKDKWERWEEVVPFRLYDIYRGSELGYCLDIAAVLNNRGSYDAAHAILRSQDHSGMTYSLTTHMIREFCDRGKAFVEYVESL